MRSWARSIAAVTGVAVLLASAACDAPPAEPVPTATPGTAIGSVPTVVARVEGSTTPDRGVTALAAWHDDVWLAVGDTLLASPDRGAHWSIVAPLPPGVETMAFTSASDGWAGTRTALNRTTDGGASWHVVSASAGARVTSVRFADELHGGVQTAAGELLLTHDGGKSWSANASPCSERHSGLRLFTFVGTGSVWALCHVQVGQGEVFDTTDGGSNWSLLTYSARGHEDLPKPSVSLDADAVDAFFADEHHGWMVNRCCLEKTIDGGRTWSQAWVTFGVIPSPNYIVFTSADRGYALGGGGFYATRDGTRSWTKVYQYGLPGSAWPGRNASGMGNKAWRELLPDYAVDNAAINWPSAWVVAAHCEEVCRPELLPRLGTATQRQCGAFQLLATHDAGKSWTQYVLPGVTVDSIEEFNSDVVRVATDSGMFESRDEGAPWRRIHAPPLPDPAPDAP